MPKRVQSGASAPSPTPAPSSSPASDHDKARTVFLVHGRDLKRTNGVRAFLQNLDILVIEWEEARERTGNPNAYVHDIVVAGMAASQATLALSRF